ncbi:TetR/AcrR family transcriptional regulator [Corynebacterium sp. TA-R-1]|uniref:TetR/AcrR family transcriptional regulator n=1 Tax=Corynebacterium stercoris TaxID=2943490 RepID=A0ABT1FY37_9CORY|nr:helix-turn-helix domain-containing protein [Corynebacterium stercoris]MCP1386682.1 TetR/AcrR family transcriptional regulator [Corynebacterium stercoris]
MQLSREAITAAALEILGTYGLADVSMRRLATTLGVAPGALYWHIENKQELIASMAAAIAAPVVENPPADPEALCAALRRAVLGVQDGAEVVVTAIGQPEAQIGGALSETFTRVVAGVAGNQASARDVRAAAHGLIHLTLGAAAVQQSGRQLAQATGEAGAAAGERDAAAEHAAAVRLMLRGLAAQHGDSPAVHYD